MLLERHADGPVAVRAESPRLRAPARIHEGDGFRDVLVGEHGPQDLETLGLGHLVGLLLDAVRLGPHDRRKDDVRALEEAGAGKRLPNGIVAAGIRIGIEKVLRIRVPKRLVELEKHLRVRAHLELLDGLPLPPWELGLELHNVILQDTYREGHDGICGLSQRNCQSS